MRLFKNKKEAKRFKKILKGYASGGNPVSATHSFVKDFLNPQPDRYDLTYRYEHSLRVALWGKRIAEAEGWDSEPLVMACLLHDTGYPFCETMEEWNMHPTYGAEVARLFLEKIGYDEELTERICQAIRIHDKWNDVPEDATPFELSVRDADDLDRFDIMRVCMIGRSDIGERSARELIEVCENRQRTLTDWQDRICGTDVAKAFWEEKLQMRRQFYEALQAEMQGTLEMEDFLKKEQR
ncbi:MAG: HD domain-containing protein [Lachnospiraceae bacterium]|nr:HD domain-containing protein [Lachnospiraceae bacterium]